MGAIKRLRAHADKRRAIELEETEVFLDGEKERERIKRLAEDILDAYRFLQSRQKRGRKHVSDSRVDEGTSIFSEISEDIEGRIGK